MMTREELEAEAARLERQRRGLVEFRVAIANRDKARAIRWELRRRDAKEWPQRFKK